MNILVVRTDKLGDFITSLPVMCVLKKYNHKNKITACISPINKTLAEQCWFIDEIIIDDACNVFELARKIKRGNFDASITLYSNTRVAFAQFLAKLPKTIAPATKIAQIFYTNRVVQRRSEVKMSEFEYNLELTKELFYDINLRYEKPLLSFNNSSVFFDKFCKVNKIKKEILAFHVGFGGSSDANLSLDEYEILIRDVLKNNIYFVVLSFGPDEKELCEKMKQRLNGEELLFYISLEGLVHFAELISNFKLFISTSTGTYHLASLVGCNTITFFADTPFASSQRWKSVGELKKQKHFMLPSKEKKRSEVFKEIRSFLNSY